MRRLTANTLILSILVSPGVVLADQHSPTPISTHSTAVKLKQVELTEKNELKGRFLNAAGLPIAGVPVAITVRESDFKVSTDEQGQFSLVCPKGGRAVLRIGEEVFACRTWLHGTAPPKAIKSIAIVAATENIVLGNMHMNGIPGSYISHVHPGRLLALSGKQLIGLGLIAGGTVAIAVSANDDDAS